MFVYFIAFAIVILAIFGFTRSHNANEYWSNARQWMALRREQAVLQGRPQEARQQADASNERVPEYIEEENRPTIAEKLRRQFDAEISAENHTSQPMDSFQAVQPELCMPVNLSGQNATATPPLPFDRRMDQSELYKLFLRESVLYGHANHQPKESEQTATPADANRQEFSNNEEIDHKRMYFGESNMKYQHHR